jgi:hypothetical protein
MISGIVSRASALFLILIGLALLFAADELLPRLTPGFPRDASWLGQLIAAAWLALGALNWLSRAALLGGIYGRPVVLANAALYFISAMVLLRAAGGAGARSVWLWAFGAVTFLGASVYGWLLFRGPVGRDLEVYRGS